MYIHPHQDAAGLARCMRRKGLKMHTIPVNEEIYSGSGWAVAAILNGRVIAFQKIEHPDAGDVAAAVEAPTPGSVCIPTIACRKKSSILR